MRRQLQGCLVAVTGAALLGSPVRLAAQVRQPPEAVRGIAGCYALTAGEWSRPPRGGPTEPALPSAIQLDTLPVVSRSGSEGYRVTPDVTSYHELPFVPVWRPLAGDSVEVSWWDGYNGPIMRLRRDGQQLRGRVQHGTHVSDAPGARGTVTATRVPCPRPARRPA